MSSLTQNSPRSITYRPKDCLNHELDHDFTEIKLGWRAISLLKMHFVGQTRIRNSSLTS